MRTSLALFRFQGNTDTEIFNNLLKNMLIPELEKGDFVILDNVSFHKSEKTKIILEEAGINILFLPPYSPDFNPIEQYWAILKCYVRKINYSFDNFLKILDEFLNKKIVVI